MVTPDKLDIQLLTAQDRCIRCAQDSPDMAYKHKWYIAYTRLCNYRLERNIKRAARITR